MLGMTGMTSMPSRCCVLTLSLLAVALIAACSKSTASKATIPRYDRMPGYERVFFTSLFVIGVGENEEKRRLFEDVFSRVLSGDSTTSSCASPSTVFSRVGQMETSWPWT